LSVLALLSVLVTGDLHADYREPYARGLAAYERGEWAETVRFMDQAITLRAEASGLFRRYTPHFYRGYALAQLGDCRAALLSLDEAERQGRLSRDETADLERARRACETRIEVVERAIAQAQQEIDRAATAAAAVALLEGDPVMAREWQSGAPSFSFQQQQALDALAEARTRVAEAERRLDIDLANQAGAMGHEALEALERLRAVASQRRDEVRLEVERVLAEIRELGDTTQKDLRFVASHLEPLPPTLSEIRNRLEATLELAEGAESTTAPADLRVLRERLSRELNQLRQAAQFPPPRLQEAVSAFVAADYSTVLELLEEPGGFRDRRARGHAFLLRAASYFSLHRMGGSESQELLEAARIDLAELQRQPVQVAIHPRAFSPAFIAFYEREILTDPPAPRP
jgi:hypothetical protein